MTRKFTLLSVAFCVCLIAANLFETKIFDAGPITLTGGFIIFPLSYIINDCISEVYGTKKARFVIWTAFLMNLFVWLSGSLVKILPPAPFWDGQAHFEYIFNANLRISAASMAAFVCGSLANAALMGRMKLRDGESRFGLRTIISTIAGESIDSVIFFPIAFFGIGSANIIRLMVTQIILKTAYEIVALPVTTRFVAYLKSSGEGAQDS